MDDLTNSAGTLRISGTTALGGVGALTHIDGAAMARLTLPSALTFTIAIEVVGEIEALKPMAIRPAFQTILAAVEFLRPVHSMGDAVENQRR